MFELKATKGNIDLSEFNLSSLIEESNQNARDIASHNEEVVKRTMAAESAELAGGEEE